MSLADMQATKQKVSDQKLFNYGLDGSRVCENSDHTNR
jgi:hypothetical protein